MRSLILLLAALAPTAALADAARLTQWWTGSFTNAEQVRANSAPGEPVAEELTRTRREMRVERVIAPQLGENAVLLHEYKAPEMAVAHRARVYVLTNLPDGRIRAVQHFFRDGPTYDRAPTTAARVATMKTSDFNFFPGCDLFFSFDAATGRYAGGMPVRTCVYEHLSDGFVYAEFDQFVWPDAVWYRDRSIKVATGTVRGSIDGFTYLRFRRVP
jgi:hypothetical protein